MKLHIDKALPTPLHYQIVGEIEYRISTGIYAFHSVLPPVRHLSKELGVAPLTVSQAYQELKKRGLIETIPGKGTYVSSPANNNSDNQLAQLKERFQLLIEEAKSLGLAPVSFLQLVAEDIYPYLALEKPKIAIIGNSNSLNLSYIATINEILPEHPIDTFTFDEFFSLSAEIIERYELYLTLPSCISLLRSRIRNSIQIKTLRLIPVEKTRMQLASLPIDTPVTLLSMHKHFLPSMLQGVKQFAPHLGKMRSLLLDESNCDKLTSQMGQIIYSRDCLQELQQRGLLGNALEYQHLPDVRHLREILEPSSNNIPLQA